LPELGNKPPKSQGHKCLIDPLECNTCNTDKVSTRSNGSGTILGKRTCRLVGALTNEKAFRNQPTAIFHRRFCLSISADDGPCAWNYFAARASNWHVGLGRRHVCSTGVPRQAIGEAVGAIAGPLSTGQQRSIVAAKVWIGVLLVLFPIGLVNGISHHAWAPTISGAVVSALMIYVGVAQIRRLRRTLN